MQIHQLNVSHVEVQDRLLLRLNTRSAEEFRFWLTRRMTLRLIPALDQTLGQLEANQAHMMTPEPASQQMLTELKRDAFLQEADFRTPYAEQAQTWPLGDEPMLVTDVELQRQGSGVLITLKDRQAGPASDTICQLNMPVTMLHGLAHLLHQAMEKAQWVSTARTPESFPGQAPAPLQGYRH